MARYLSVVASLIHSFSERAHRECGQVIMITALLLPVSLGFAGLSVDVGLAASGQRDVQNAADSAALAGAGILHDGGTVTAARAAAFSWAQKNGYTNAETTVNIPPASGSHAGDSSYVEVLIQHSRPTVFIRALSINSTTAHSRAVAHMARAKNYAMVVLNNTKCSAYNQSSNNTLVLNGGGVMVNSSCKPSGSQGGGSTLNAQFVDYYDQGAWSLSNNATTSVPATGTASRVTDPLATLTRPVPGAASQDSGGTAASPKLLNITGSATLHPGTYYGGIKISSSGTITFLPGTYIMAGGGLTYSGSAAISGNGVTFFNTDDPSSPKNGACGSITLQGGGTLSLVAPTTGTYKGMLFWQDDACTVDMKYTGNSYTITGVIYLPKAQLSVSGGGSLGALQIIVDSFQYSGSTTVTVNYQNFVSAGPITLVE